MKCKSCGRLPSYPSWKLRRGAYCPACYTRWRWHGFRGDAPPPPLRPCYGSGEGRREDYGWLRTEIGLSIRAAAERVGVSERTAERYEKRFREATA